MRSVAVSVMVVAALLYVVVAASPTYGSVPSGQNAGVMDETVMPSAEETGALHDPAIDPCCDLAQGDRVVLLVDHPDGASGLLAGALGTVMCCTIDDPLPILVSWDGWTEGHNNTSYCDIPPPAFPVDSGWWVDCAEIELASCGLQRGDCVQLLVDNPDGATDLLTGAQGFIVCSDPDDLGLTLLVSWNGWREGHDDEEGWCHDDPLPYPSDSGWWMSCDQVTADCDPDCNGNGVSDVVDIADGTNDDCDGNGVPDECDYDGDGDGVPDACDDCPGTGSGDPVDADGCSTADDDDDGVLNDQDDCPGTASGDPVDGDGCSTADDDGDGVLNDDDLCGSTPTCATNVDANGCAVDSDGDGNVDGCEPPAQGCCGSTGPVAPLGMAVGLLLLSRFGGWKGTRRH